MKSIFICFLLVSVSVLLLLPLSSNANTLAYVYYEGATCSNYTNNIQGTFIYGYNDERMSGRGIIKTNYNGACKYFDGGFYDFMYERSRNKKGSFMLNGYCLTCNGVVGCTKIKNDCSGFQTYVPQGHMFTSAGSAPNSGISSSISSSSENIISYAIADQVEMSVYKEINQGLENDSMYAVLGAIFGMTLFFVLVASSRITKNILLKGRKAKLDSRNLLDTFDSPSSQQGQQQVV